MRQKADKLEKGKWYADIDVEGVNETFLKFKERNSSGFDFSEQRGPHSYSTLLDGITVGFPNIETNWYIPTPEDIEKYNLNETE